MKGDCNICANGKLPSDSATCVECGLSRKNYKPLTNYDRLISKTPEEMAQAIEEFSYDVVTCPKDKCHLEPMSPYDSLDRNECRKCWLKWLKSPVEDSL